MNKEVKELLSSVETKSIDTEKRTIDFVGSTNSKDRMGDVIDPKGWQLENFKANPVFLWGHNGRSIPPIGRALDVQRTERGLNFKIEFASKEIHPFADTVFKLYQGGFLKGVSVGFIPKRREIMLDANGDFIGFKFLEQELLELSAVSIPANPDALVQEAVSGELCKEAQEFISKSLGMENGFIQSIEELKKEILLMGKLTEPSSESTNKLTNEETIDKRIENVENKLTELQTELMQKNEAIQELKSYMEMHKSATEIFSMVKNLLDGMKNKSMPTNAMNPFLSILAPGNVPDGMPEGQKTVLEAIRKATEKFSASNLKTK